MTSRSANTLNNLKTKVPSAPARSQNSANEFTPKHPSEKEKNQTNNCDTRTGASGLQLYTCVTDAKHSALSQLIVEKLGLCVKLSLLKDKTTFGLAPLQCFSCKLRTKDWMVVKPENWLRKLNFLTELGYMWGLSHRKTISRLTKSPCKVCVWEKMNKQKKKKKEKKNKLGLHVRWSFRQDKTKFGQAPLQCFSWN